MQLNRLLDLLCILIAMREMDDTTVYNYARALLLGKQQPMFRIIRSATITKEKPVVQACITTGFEIYLLVLTMILLQWKAINSITS
jgi:hypothetical protein